MNVRIGGRELTLSAEARYFAGVPDLRSHLAQIESPDFWRRINPSLAITDTPLSHCGFGPSRTESPCASYADRRSVRTASQTVTRTARSDELR